MILTIRKEKECYLDAAVGISLCDNFSDYGGGVCDWGSLVCLFD